MRALEQPLVVSRVRLFDGTPVPALLILAVAWLVAVAALPVAAARIAGLAAGHGALLGTALAWTAVERRDRWAPLEAAVVLGVATICARTLPGGALAYLAVPAWVASRRPVWRPGVGDVRAILGGAVFGLLLGLHLFVNASLTLGYRMRPAPIHELIGWWAYDVGANVLATEAFFRLALFRRVHRRWSLPAAVAVSTAASVARYLVDPLLPHSLPILAGATFYLALLGAGNCWLLARTGSLAAPVSAGLLFFAAYRLLAPR